MFVADSWKEYKLIDASDGERLEQWGKYILIRPDPQIIWSGTKKSPLWKKADGIYKRSNKGGGAWIKNELPEQWNIKYGKLGFVCALWDLSIQVFFLSRQLTGIGLLN